jgi:hypothetical protein
VEAQCFIPTHWHSILQVILWCCTVYFTGCIIHSVLR